MFTPKSILLHLDSSAGTAARVRISRSVAEGFDAHVNGVFDVQPALLRYPLAMEWVLGGATQSVLQAMTLPVLMVH